MYTCLNWKHYNYKVCVCSVASRLYTIAYIKRTVMMACMWMISRTTLFWHYMCLTCLCFLRGHSKWLVCRCSVEPHLHIFLFVTTEASSGPVTVVCDSRSLTPSLSSSASTSSSSSSSPCPWLVSCSCNHCFLTSCSISLFLFSAIRFPFDSSVLSFSSFLPFHHLPS